MIFAMDLIYKILQSKPSFTSDDIGREFDVYFNNNDYWAYDSAALPEETYILTQYLLDNCGYIDLDGYHQYTKDPGAIVSEKVKTTFALPNAGHVCVLMYSNLSVWLIVGPMGMRIVTFLEKEYTKLKNAIPTPHQMMEYRLTGRIEFYEITDDYFLDKNLG